MLEMPNKFIEIQPSNGIMKDKEGNTVALVWVFRPDVVVENRHWFEAINPTHSHNFLCIEVGSDKIPVNCKAVYLNLDGPDECERLSDEKIIECFKFCCNLLAKKYTDDEAQRLGSDIIKDAFLGNVTKD